METEGSDDNTEVDNLGVPLDIGLAVDTLEFEGTVDWFEAAMDVVEMDVLAGAVKIPDADDCVNGTGF